ncbi:30S ribosomal protein S13 [Candidatus Woesearchaeota archaeon]|nr:30S ribosomal protein S13 [Candidatus Woesearchaeota archaeon]
MPDDKDFQYLVRIANTDLDGKKATFMALQKIKGIGFSFANVICNLTGIDKAKKAGYLSQLEIEKLDKAVRDPAQLHIPAWLLNRRKDYETGEDKHVILGDLDFSKSNDVKRMQVIRSYRGMRHALKLPVRGQRTRSNFRKNKGNVLGVKRSKVAAAAAASKGKDDKGKGGADKGKAKAAPGAKDKKK